MLPITPVALSSSCCPPIPAVRPVRKRFIELMLEAFGITAGQIVQVLYGRYSLPGYRFTPEHPRDTIVLFGGGAAACAGEAPRRGGSNHGVPRLAEIACR